MPMLRRRSYLAGIAALAAMLFAQVAFALAACDTYREHSRAQMIAALAERNPGCHEQGVDAGLCVSHCQSGDQVLDKHQLKVPDLLSQPVRVFRGGRASYPPAPLPVPAVAPGAGPPLHLLYLSLLF